MLQGWGGVIVHNPPDCADLGFNKSESYRLSSKVIVIMENVNVILHTTCYHAVLLHQSACAD